MTNVCFQQDLKLLINLKDTSEVCNGKGVVYDWFEGQGR